MACRSLRYAWLLVLCPLLAACGSDDAPADQPAAGASGAAGSGGGAGSGGQAGTGGQAGSSGASGASGASCTPAPPRLGTDPASVSLAADPARCGQPAHTWLSDAKLGEVTGSTPGPTYKTTLLSSLVAGTGVTGAPPPVHDVSTFRIRYTTQDRGKLIEATAAVAMPQAPVASLDRVAVLHGTSGFTDGCGPSKDSESLLLLAYVASLGYVVVGPDYLGLRGDDQKTGFPHPYLAGQPTAIASLDSLRAAGNLAAQQGQCPSARTVVIGGSQGGHAALWVDRLGPHYAAELDLRGIVATVPPADMVGEAERALKEPVSASANVAAMLSVTPAWYGHGDKLSQVFVPPKDTELPAALAADCDPEKAVSGLTKLEEVFQPALLDAAKNGTLAQQQPFGCIIAENGLTTTSVPRLATPAPSYGILFVVGENDTLVHTPIERVAYGTLCNAGLPLNFLECAGASHTKATTWALPEILAFTQARFAGEAFTTACQVSAPTTCKATPPPK